MHMQMHMHGMHAACSKLEAVLQPYVPQATTLCTHAATLCIQIIRGVYEPFVRDWHAALGAGLLVLRVEDLLDSPAQSDCRGKVYPFGGATDHCPVLLRPSLQASGCATHSGRAG